MNKTNETNDNQNTKYVNYSGFSQDLLIYEVAKVREIGSEQKYLVEYITISTIPWSTGETNYLPLNSSAAEAIRDAQLKGKEVYISKDWQKYSTEVLITDIEINPKIDMFTYKRRATNFIKAFINPMMASVHASIIYGFTTLNNKFIENGFVFSEATRTLKYIEIMERSEDLADSNPELSEELMNDLEKYIEYRDTLDRSNFIWNESEKYCDIINAINENDFVDNEEFPAESQARTKIDDHVREFQTKIRTLNNLK